MTTELNAESAYALLAECRRLRAENAKLREALRETIAECEFHGAGNAASVNKARAALKEGENG